MPLVDANNDKIENVDLKTRNTFFPFSVLKEKKNTNYALRLHYGLQYGLYDDFD